MLNRTESGRVECFQVDARTGRCTPVIVHPEDVNIKAIEAGAHPSLSAEPRVIGQARRRLPLTRKKNPQVEPTQDTSCVFG